jgi:hypothetical protein
MDTALVNSFQPEWEEVVEYGRAGVQNWILQEAQNECVMLFGTENYFGFVNDIGSNGVYGRKENVIRTMWGRMNAPNQDMAILTLHSKFISLPVIQAAQAAAMAGSNYVRSPRFTDVYGSFDLFDYAAQNFTFVNASLSRMGICKPTGEIVPVLDQISRFSNAVMLVPPTTSSKSVGIDKQLRRKKNDRAMAAFWSALDDLHRRNKSAVLTIDPTGSTAEHIYDNGQLSELRHKRVNPLTAKMIQERFMFVVPQLFWWDKNPREASWAVIDAKSTWHTPESNNKHSATMFHEIMDELAYVEEYLSGANVSFGASAAGRLALAETLQPAGDTQPKTAV